MAYAQLDPLTAQMKRERDAAASRLLGGREWAVASYDYDLRKELRVKRKVSERGKRPVVIEIRHLAGFDDGFALAVQRAVELLKPKPPRYRVASLCNLPGRGRYAR